jgi:hypothetical protein
VEINDEDKNGPHDGDSPARPLPGP